MLPRPWYPTDPQDDLDEDECAICRKLFKSLDSEKYSDQTICESCRDELGEFTCQSISDDGETVYNYTGGFYVIEHGEFYMGDE